MADKRVESIREVDLRNIEMPIVAVHKSPEDYPGVCVGRIYKKDEPTDTVIIKKTVTEIEMDIRKHTRMTFVPRGAADVASLVGVWW